jgi:hypothetical protein
MHNWSTVCYTVLYYTVGQAMEMEQSDPKRRHIKFRRRVITQKKAYNIQNKAKVWNQEKICIVRGLREFWLVR